MRIRDAVEADAPALATFVDAPATVMRDIVHDRTVRVAVPDDAPEPTDPPPGGGDADADSAVAAGDDDRVDGDDGDGTDDSDDGDGTDDYDGTHDADDRTDRVAVADPEVMGFVSFDARDGVVHVTYFGGQPDACERLLAEPVAFARRERLPVEAIVPEDEPERVDAVEAAGFDRMGTGPQFSGSPTVRFRQQPCVGPGAVNDSDG